MVVDRCANLVARRDEVSALVATEERRELETLIALAKMLCSIHVWMFAECALEGNQRISDLEIVEVHVLNRQRFLLAQLVYLPLDLEDQLFSGSVAVPPEPELLSIRYSDEIVACSREGDVIEVQAVDNSRRVVGSEDA